MKQGVISISLPLLGIILSLCLGNENTGAERNSLPEEDGIVDVSVLGCQKKDIICICDTVDLKNKKCNLPEGLTLKFEGGIIKNGTLVGNMTRLKSKSKCFDRVRIQGTWNVPIIKSSLFVDLSYDNALKDVFALSNPSVYNMIYIENGNYQVTARRLYDVCVLVCSNSDITLNGTITLIPNNYSNYDIVRVKGDNISIKGKANIIGDKHSHKGTNGEWGMGINLKGAVNTTIRGLTIKDCWGDCIYVGGNSRNVLIERCVLDYGRRQGISVTKANGVTIRNCIITNVGGTAPEYAIDIEPNRRDSVDNILIEKVKVKDCKGGFLVYGGKPKDGAKTPWIGNVTIKNCQVSSKSKRPISIKRCDEVKIEKCSLYAQKGRTAISVTETGKAIVQNNTVSIGGSILEKAKSSVKNLVGKVSSPVYVKTSGQSIVKNNKIVER